MQSQTVLSYIYDITFFKSDINYIELQGQLYVHNQCTRCLDLG